MSRPEFAALVASLRRCAKAKGVMYSRLAQATTLSEPTIKRLFAGRACNIEHLFKLCDALGVSFFELAAMAADERPRAYVLTEAQETYFAADPLAYGIFCRLLAGRPLAELTAEIGVERRRLQAILRELEALGLVERHPEDRIVCKVDGPVHWLSDGPMVRAFLLRTGHEVLQAAFAHRADAGTYFHVAAVDLAENGVEELKRELTTLVERYTKRAARDRSFVAKEDRHTVGWALALTPYTIGWAGDQPVPLSPV